jgi:hypothetical protein
MTGSDPYAARWAQDRRVERQEVNTHRVYGRQDSATGEVMVGWGGCALQSTDNDRGARNFELDVRPVLLGLVEVRVAISTQAVDAQKPHSKSTYLCTTPEALRELATQLLQTADAADAMKVRPRPVT